MTVFYISDAMRQVILTLSSSKVTLRKEDPRHQVYGIDGVSVFIEDGMASGKLKHSLSSEDDLVAGYSEIAKKTRTLQKAISEKTNRLPQDITVVVRIAYSDRAVFGGSANALQRESHLIQSLLRVIWKTQSGFLASDEMLVDFSRFEVEGLCDRLCETYDGEGPGNIISENFRNSGSLFLPAQVTARIMKACISGLIRFEEWRVAGLSASYSLLDCPKYDEMKLTHSFDMVGQDCVQFDIAANPAGYCFVPGDRIETMYGTARHEPGRLTFSTGPRAIIAKRGNNASGTWGYEYYINRVFPMVHEQYSSSSLLSFVLEGRERESGGLARFRLRGYPIELLERIKLVSEGSIFAHEGCLLCVGGSVVTL